MRIINVVTQKGGTGKTETCKNLALGLTKAGKRVLVIDLDPQANTTTNLLQTSKSLDSKLMEELKREFDIVLKEIEVKGEQPTGVEGIDIIHRYAKRYAGDDDASAVLDDPATIKKVIQHTRYERLDIIAASSKLIQIDLKLKSAFFGAESKLSQALDLVKDEYDVTIIDHSPFVNALTINGMVAAKNDGDLIVIPVKLECASMDGMDTIFQQMLEILTCGLVDFDFKLLFTMVNRNKAEKELESTLRYLFPNNCFNTSIRYQAKPVNVASNNKKILIDDSKSGVAYDYRAFVDECLEMLF